MKIRTLNLKMTRGGRLEFCIVLMFASYYLFCFPFPALSYEQKGLSSRSSFPDYFKVYSKDGRESLTGACVPEPPNINRDKTDNAKCFVMNVRFINPEDRTNADTLSLTLEEYAKKDPALAKKLNNPNEEKKAKAELAEAFEKVRQEFCSVSSKRRPVLEAKAKDKNTGPKRRQRFERLLDACKDKDPPSLVRRLNELDANTCEVWVDSFSLHFKKIGQDHWIDTRPTPSLLSNTLKTYELKRSDERYSLWTLTETIIPLTGTGEKSPKAKPEQSTWSWDNYEQYEISCDFISHRLIQSPRK